MAKGTYAADSAGMSLDELVKVAHEAGIDPETIREAAQRFEDQQAPLKAPWLLGVRPYTEVFRAVDGTVTDENWDEVVAELRSAFQGPTGEATRLGKSSEWYGGTELTATQVSLTPQSGRTKVKARLNAWAVPVIAYGPATFLGALIIVVKFAKVWRTDPAAFRLEYLLVAIVVYLASLLAIRLGVGSWYQNKLRQMSSALSQTENVLSKALPSVEPTAVMADDATDVQLRLGHLEQ